MRATSHITTERLLKRATKEKQGNHLNVCVVSRLVLAKALTALLALEGRLLLVRPRLAHARLAKGGGARHAATAAQRRRTDLAASLA